jgi:predicted signal transduction protein with EAL and GGDEF domain
MEKIKLPIMIATAYLVVFVITLSFSSILAISMLLVSLSPLPIIWMVYRVLRDGIPSEFTFEERFYEDYEYQRVRIK